MTDTHQTRTEKRRAQKKREKLRRKQQALESAARNAPVKRHEFAQYMKQQAEKERQFEQEIANLKMAVTYLKETLKDKKVLTDLEIEMTMRRRRREDLTRIIRSMKENGIKQEAMIQQCLMAGFDPNLFTDIIGSLDDQKDEDESPTP